MILDDIGNIINKSLAGQYSGPYHNFMDKGYGGAIVTGILLIVIISVVIARNFDYFTDKNMKNKTNAMIKQWEPIYGAASNDRKSLAEYVNTLITTRRINQAQRCLSNFYIMTCNASSIFMPGEGGKFPIVSIDALSYTLRAGCRGFIFDVLEKLDDRGKPYVFVVDSDPNKKWRRTSMNFLPLRDPMNRLRAEAFGEGSLGQAGAVQLKNTSDPIFVYLRFIKQHKPAFYDAVAEVLDNAFKDYRLDYTWAAARRQSDFFTTNVDEFMGKIIVLSNQKPSGTKLEELINVTSQSSSKIWYRADDIKNITDEEIVKQKPIIQQNVTIAFEPQAEQNNLDWKRAHGLGIQMVGMNWFNQSGKQIQEYRDFFGDFSFRIKPDTMRYTVQVTSGPRKPGQEANMNKGQVTMPQFNLRQ